MDFRWHGYSFPVLGRGSLHLMRRLDAMVVRNDGEGEWEDASRTRWYFQQAASEDPYRIRRFVASAGLSQLSPGALPDLALVGAVKDLIDSGDLVGVYHEAPGGRKAKASDSSTQQRELVREIERETRGRLVNSSRTYKLIADADLADVPDRDRYEVVGQRDAQRILDDLASQPGTAPGLAALLAQARDRLSRDWRPPLQPNGLVLLRRVVAPRMPTVDPGPAMTPSQIRKALLGWIGIDVVDDRDQPWTGVLDLTLADGAERSVGLSDEGSVTLENIEPGTVTVNFPEVTAKTHTVKQGECLSSIAHAYGFPSYKDIYNHADNADFRKKRPNPNLIYPGDEIHIPDYKEPPRSLATGKRHRIVMKQPLVKLRLAVRDSTGKSAAGCRYRLTVDSLDEQKSVPSNGLIETVVSASATEGTLWVYWNGDDEEPAPIQLKIGHLDPPDLPTGYQARLTNLGYRRGKFSGKPGRRTRLALADFQRAEGLQVTGEADKDTCERLSKRHDQES